MENKDFMGEAQKIINDAKAEGFAAGVAAERKRIAALIEGGGAAAVPAVKAAPVKVKKRKNSWSGLSDEARLARVNAIRKGKGLAPKDSL